MINLTSLDLDNLERIASGGFGVVYKDGSKAIKIYRPRLKTGYWSFVSNPALRFNKTKLNRLLKKDKLIDNTDLIQDIVCNGNKYVGVVYPYYNGITLNKCMNYPLDCRIDMSRQMIVKAKELTDNNIYPLDYKLDNMIYIDDEVKLLDLDDVYTKVKIFKSDRLLRKSNILLDETIKTLLGEYHYYSYVDLDLREVLLKKRRKTNDNYDDISKYLDEKEKPLKFALVDLDTDLDEVKGNNDYLYLFITDNVINRNIIDFVKNNNFGIYDVVQSNKLNDYLSNNFVEECVDKTGGKVLKKIK